MILFEKNYDGESICSIEGDVDEAFNEAFNPALANIPKDEFGLHKGTFTIKIEWSPEGGIQ